jgi:GxxExxY protein
MVEFDAQTGFAAEPDAELDALARQVVDAAFQVHKALGPGFLESVHRDALCVELGFQGIPFEREKLVTLTYRGVEVGRSRLDLLIAGRLIVELKTVDALAPIHTAQAISYLKATGLSLALLINFNVPLLKDGLRRVVRAPARTQPRR